MTSVSVDSQLAGPELSKDWSSVKFDEAPGKLKSFLFLILSPGIYI